MTDTKPSTKRSSSARTSGNVLSDEERAALTSLTAAGERRITELVKKAAS